MGPLGLADKPSHVPDPRWGQAHIFLHSTPLLLIVSMESHPIANWLNKDSVRGYLKSHRSWWREKVRQWSMQMQYGIDLDVFPQLCEASQMVTR
jgi:hypothetical protein